MFNNEKARPYPLDISELWNYTEDIQTLGDNEPCHQTTIPNQPHQSQEMN